MAQLPETRPFPKSPPFHTHLASPYVSQSVVIIQVQIHVCAQSLQSCPTQCVPMDCSPPGFSVHGILQVRILEWVVLPSSRWSSWPRDQTFIPSLSCVLNWQMGSILPESPGKHPATNILNRKCTPGLFGLSSIKTHQDLARTEKFKQQNLCKDKVHSRIRYAPDQFSHKRLQRGESNSFWGEGCPTLSLMVVRSPNMAFALGQSCPVKCTVDYKFKLHIKP